jgi:hypothetical protein
LAHHKSKVEVVSVEQQQRRDWAKKTKENYIGNVFISWRYFQVQVTSLSRRSHPLSLSVCLSFSLSLSLFCVADETIHSRLSNNGFTTQLIDHLLPYLELNITTSQPPPSSAPNLAADVTVGSDPPATSPPHASSSSVSVSHHPASSSVSVSHILSAIEFNYFLSELSLEFSSYEKRIVTKRCHDNSKGSNFTDIDILRLFSDRKKMKMKIKQEPSEKVQIASAGP